MLMLGLPMESDGAGAAGELLFPFIAKAAPAPAAPAINAITSHFLLLLCGASPGDALVTDTCGGGAAAEAEAPERATDAGGVTTFAWTGFNTPGCGTALATGTGTTLVEIACSRINPAWAPPLAAVIRTVAAPDVRFQ